jgi:hypothetical protein
MIATIFKRQYLATKAFLPHPLPASMASFVGSGRDFIFGR